MVDARVKLKALVYWTEMGLKGGGLLVAFAAFLGLRPVLQSFATECDDLHHLLDALLAW